MSAKAPGRLGRERAARRGPDGGHLASRWRLEQKRPPARDAGAEGPLARRSASLKQQQLKQLVAELQARWQRSPNRLGHALEGLYVAYLIGLQGARCLDHDLLRAERAAPRDRGPRSCQAGERHRGGETPGRPHPGNTKGPRKSGVPLSTPERRPGKRGARHSGRRPVELWDPVEEPPRPQGGKKARSGGRRARGRPSLRTLAGPRPQGPPKDQLWVLDPVGERQAAEQATPCACRGRSRWQKELELAFDELLDTNRRLRAHLILQLRGGREPDRNPREAPGSPGRPGTPPSPAVSGPAAGATRPEANSTHTTPQAQPGRSEGQRRRSVPRSPEVQPLIPDTPPAQCPEAPEELPQLDTPRAGSTVLLSTQEPGDKAGLEQRRWNRLEPLGQTEQLQIRLESQSAARELGGRRTSVNPAANPQESGSTPLPASPELGSTPLPTSPEPGSTLLPASPEPGSTPLPASLALGSTSLMASRVLGSTSRLVSREPGSTSHLVFQTLGSIPHLTSRELGGSSHQASRALESTPLLASQDSGSTLHLTSQESGSTTLLTPRELGSTFHLASRGLGSTSHLTSRELGSTPLLTSRELGSTLHFTSRELGSTPLLASRELGSSLHFTSGELGSTPLLASQGSGSTLHLTSQESGSTTHLTSQGSGSTSGLTSPCPASLLTSPEQGEETEAKGPRLPTAATSAPDEAQPRRKPRDLQQQRQLHQQFLEEARRRLREFQEAG